jgi:hypothetical protein
VFEGVVLSIFVGLSSKLLTTSLEELLIVLEVV